MWSNVQREKKIHRDKISSNEELNAAIIVTFVICSVSFLKMDTMYNICIYPLYDSAISNVFVLYENICISFTNICPRIFQSVSIRWKVIYSGSAFFILRCDLILANFLKNLFIINFSNLHLWTNTLLQSYLLMEKNNQYSASDKSIINHGFEIIIWGI